VPVVQWLHQFQPGLPESREAPGEAGDRDWLRRFRAPSLAGELLLEGLAVELEKEGVPLLECSTSLLLLHPEIYATNFVWTRGAGAHGHDRTYAYLASLPRNAAPMFTIKAGGPALRRRLDGPPEALEWDMLRGFAARGATDFAIFPLVFTDDRRSFFYCLTDRPGGFLDAEIALIESILPVLALRVEILSSYATTRKRLDVYLGQNAARWVLTGRFKRGSGEPIDAIIWMCDLRGFTALSDRRAAAEVVPILDRYFETVAAPVGQAGGEILKFIGDAMLAVFPVGEDGPAGPARRALAAAAKAIDDVATIGAEIGVALHVGQVMYGNIGAHDRLDFTVIGAAVNEVCRVEGLCKPLGAPLLVTGALAAAATAASDADEALVSLGAHQLEGVSEPREIFTLARYRR
jgi:adenylate cyclase